MINALLGAIGPKVVSSPTPGQICTQANLHATHPKMWNETNWPREYPL